MRDSIKRYDSYPTVVVINSRDIHVQLYRKTSAITVLSVDSGELKQTVIDTLV